MHEEIQELIGRKAVTVKISENVNEFQTTLQEITKSIQQQFHFLILNK